MSWDRHTARSLRLAAEALKRAASALEASINDRGTWADPEHVIAAEAEIALAEEIVFKARERAKHA
jgi:hypothetical protein